MVSVHVKVLSGAFFILAAGLLASAAFLPACGLVVLGGTLVRLGVEGAYRAGVGR